MTVVEACKRCGTEHTGIRISKLCVWCYAAENDRPGDVDRSVFGSVTEAGGDSDAVVTYASDAIDDFAYDVLIGMASSVPGVGMSMQYKLRDSLDRDEFIDAVESAYAGDTDRLEAIEGMGEQTAVALGRNFARRFGWYSSDDGVDGDGGGDGE